MRSLSFVCLALLVSCSSSFKPSNAADSQAPAADGSLSADAGSPLNDAASAPAADGNLTDVGWLASDATSSDRGPAPNADAGTPCSSNPCSVETVLTGLAAPIDVVLDALNAYVTVFGTGVFEAVSIANASSARNYVAYSATYLAIDSSGVYFLAYQTNEIDRVPLGGGAALPFAQAQFEPARLAVKDAYVYWTTDGAYGDAGTANVGAVMRQPVGSIIPQTLASGLADPTGIAIDANYVYWTNRGTIASNYQDGAIWRVAKDGSGNAVEMAAGQLRPEEIAVDANSVYWTNFDGGTVVQLPLSGGATPTVLASAPGSGPMGIAVDARFVYWVQNLGGAVKAVPIGGGPVTTIASGLTSPRSIATNDTWIYWVVQGSTTSASGSLMRTSKL